EVASSLFRSSQVVPRRYEAHVGQLGFRHLAMALTCLIAFAACGSGVPALPAAPASIPTPSLAPTTRSDTVQGEIFDAQAGPIGNADINLWVQQERVGYSYWWWAQAPLRSNDSGHFVAPNIPDSRITVFALKAGYVQPCVVTVDLHG